MSMSETNRVIYEMMLQTPLGKSLSDADRGFLEQELSIKPVAQIDGWIGDQIRKAAQSMAKGDFVGHPFRGNQHSDSSGAGATGGAGAQPKGAKGLKGVKVGDVVTLSTVSFPNEPPFDYTGDIVAKTPTMITILTEDNKNHDTQGNPREIDIPNGNVVGVEVHSSDDESSSGDAKSMKDDLNALEAGFQAKENTKTKNEQAKADAKAKEIKVKLTDPLDAPNKKIFIADMREAGKAVMKAVKMSNNAAKVMQQILQDPKVRASRERVAALREAMDSLQEANDYMDQFQGAYDSAKQTIGSYKGAITASLYMTNAGELWKGAMRDVYERATFAATGSKSSKKSPFGADDSVNTTSVLQDAGDKSFGLPSNIDYGHLLDHLDV